MTWRGTPLSPHVLRHTAATWLLMEGRQPLPNHQSDARPSLDADQVYSHLVAEHLREAAQTLDEMLP